MPDLNGVNGTLSNGTENEPNYSIPFEAATVLRNGLLSNPLISKDLPPESLAASTSIKFTGSDTPSLPINWRFAESVSALKALEAIIVNVLLQRKYGLEPQEVEINTDHATLFIMSTLLWIIDPGEGGLNLTPGGHKAPEILDKFFPSCDKHNMGSSFYRQAATNIYQCADGRYFHLHGSLNPDPSLESVGLPPDMPAEDYTEAVKPFIETMSKINSEEMQKRATDQYRQAGTICYSIDEFRNSEHGKANAHVGLWEIHGKPNASQPACWWPDTPSTGPKRPLAGLKVVDLVQHPSLPSVKSLLYPILTHSQTIIIAAPAITRSLAELGASVMRCTAPHLPDYGALHVDLNWGKWNCSIDLRNTEDREKLKALIMDADIVVQGYRPGVLDKYGFGQMDIIKMCENRGRGIISARENCYGWNGPWTDRSGWQQISDAVIIPSPNHISTHS
jgi:crotonobetainyl-CoA:carnitine CoA-transferase CaiB-like acyl-CoA transferase